MLCFPLPAGCGELSVPGNSPPSRERWLGLASGVVNRLQACSGVSHSQRRQTCNAILSRQLSELGKDCQPPLRLLPRARATAGTTAGGKQEP